MKKAVKIIVNVFAWVFLLFALLVTIVVFSAERNNGVPNVMGYMPMTVESDSMSPTFNKGDLVLVKEIDDLNNLEEGDVITFWTRIEGQRAKNTHRIVKVNKDEKGNVIDFTTRGDNNKGIDDELPASPNDIVGKWTGTKLNGVGKALDFLRTKKGFFMCIIIPMAIFFLFELYKFIVTLIEVKKEGNEEIDEEEIKRRAIEEYLAEQKKKEAEAEGGSEEKAEAKVEAAAENVKEKAEEKAEAVAETVTEAVEEKAEAAAEEVTEAVEENAEAAAEEVTEAVEENAEAAAEEVAEAVEENAETAAEEATETNEEKTEAVQEE